MANSDSVQYPAVKKRRMIYNIKTFVFNYVNICAYANTFMK